MVSEVASPKSANSSEDKSFTKSCSCLFRLKFAFGLAVNCNRWTRLWKVVCGLHFPALVITLGGGNYHYDLTWEGARALAKK